MKYAILLIAASLVTFCPIADVFAANNPTQDNLVSCRRSKDQPPESSTSDRSGA
ncbi:hypothetical protein NIES37_65390 [Tolypothrix tenuis PCC 7101]|uniref:Uncharacterized protein n=1 Tax=Tolypothrix tenuis PCC 7101 TaxID=231146 RepID=A0A1Z4NA20_9CYAN|nr:hypothetical protein [Aulosira sp. FACHB-113]BAY34518.1 hypothetical protein NIES2107_64230 [Nostoc carneum NIES-2107]BAZ02526.1 hypothetical protein NIES37_65390 [Tolypothrix tenuis PCC 7101]BAZ73553.1 hypothetical protein NIES50_21180 [Aulosira laxa NIES-50]